MTRARNTADELSLITAKGDLLAGSASGVQSKLAVGTNNHVLTADSSTATGLKWASASSQKTFSLLNAGGTALTGATSITVNFSAQDELLIGINGAGTGGTGQFVYMEIGGITSGYTNAWVSWYAPATYNSQTVLSSSRTTTGTYIPLGVTGSSTSSLVSGYVRISGAGTTGIKAMTFMAGASAATSQNQEAYSGYGVISTSALTSVKIVTGTNFNAGTLYVWGAA